MRRRTRSQAELAKIESREMQGWQKRRPLTQRVATESRDGRRYGRDKYGTIRKGVRR